MLLPRSARPLYTFLLAFFLVATSPALGQDAPGGAPDEDGGSPLTLEDIHASGAFYPNSFQSGKWADEGPVITYIETERVQIDGSEQPITHLMRYNLRADERERLIDGRTLMPADTDHPLRIEDYQYGPDEETVLLFTDAERVWRYKTKGYYYLYDLASGDLTPLTDRDAGFQKFAKLSPSGDRVAFVRNRDLFVVDLSTMQETRLTTDGSAGKIINGTFDWVYEEEFGLRDGWRWSPNGRYIAFFKLDESQTREFAMTNFQTRYPSYERFRYPKAGEENSEIKVGVIDMTSLEENPSEADSSGAAPQITFFDTQTWSADYSSADERYEYIARMGWTPESKSGRASVWMIRLNRDQNSLDLLYGDPAEGTVRTVLEEHEDSYIDVSGEKVTYLDDGEHFVFASENSGYRHFYLHDARTGKRVRPITTGDWEATGFHGIDTAKGYAYVTGTRKSSIERHLYRVPFSMEAAPREEAASVEPTRLTERSGMHSINMSPAETYFIDDFSAADTPPITTLHAAPGGRRLATLEGNEALRQRLDQITLPNPEFMKVPGAEEASLNAYLVKPTDFDPSKSYPLLIYVYGGPGVQTVMNRWGGARELWHKYLADELDMLVASVDNRGTGGRGKAFQDVPYRRLGIPEALDQIAAARHFAGRDFVDAGRIGIWGWSYGGYLTLMSMLYAGGPQVYDAGMAVAPVTNWRFYDTIYTERYMSTPQNNPKGYRKGSPINYAGRLTEEQDLLLVHGDYDDNVHFQNSAQMAAALQAKGKQFEYMVYPGRDHGLAGGLTRLHLFTLLTDFVRENLAAPEEALAAGSSTEASAAGGQQ